MPPDSLYVASVAETIRSKLRNTDNPAEIRRYLHELRDALYEADFGTDLSNELLDNLDENISLLRDKETDSLGSSRQNRIIDLVHRVERFCQRRQQHDETTLENSRSRQQDTELGSSDQDIMINFGNMMGFDNGSNTNSIPEPTESSQIDPAPPTDTGNDGGKVHWEFPTISKFIHTPTATEATVYAATAEQTLYAVTVDGSLRWRYSISNEIATSPVVLNGTAYIADSGGQIHAINTTNGDKKWQYYLNSNYQNNDFKGLAADENNVYIYGSDFMNGYLSAINSSLRYKSWGFEGKKVLSITTDDDTIYAATDSGLYAIEKTSGEILWNFNLGDHSNNIAQANGLIYVAGESILYAVNEETGIEKWRTAPDTHGMRPSVADEGILYIYDWFKLIAYDATNGDQLWSLDPEENIRSPAVCNGTVYTAIAQSGGKEPETLIALDGKTGRTLWSYSVNENMGHPTVSNGAVYVGTKAGSLYALPTD